jgi:hypothetical protein
MHYRNGREAKVGDHVVAWTRFGACAGLVLSLDPLERLTQEALIGFLALAVGDAPLDWGTRSPVAVTGIGGNRGAKVPLAAVLYREEAFPPEALLHADDAHWVNAAGDAVKPLIAG